MEYKPSLPEHNHNVSHSQPLKEFLEIGLSLCLIALATYFTLGFLVDVVVDRVSPQTEASINQMMSTKVVDTPKELAARRAHVQGLVDQLKKCAAVPHAPVQMISNAKANAAVIPGGGMIVFSGLLDEMRSENGLSFVLAHELAHLQHRDHLRGMGRAVVLVTISAVLTGGSGDAADLLSPATHLGATHYSRERESLADARALEILQCRYGHVGGATELFEQLGKDDDTWEASHYLRSHPSMQARIAQIRQTAAAKQWKTGGVLPLALPPVDKAARE